MFNRRKSCQTGKTGAAEAKALALELERQIDLETRRRVSGMLAIFESLEDGWREQLDHSAGFIMEAAQLREAIRTVRQTGAAPAPTALRFQVSSLFLSDCRDYLVADPQGHERMVLISGTVSGDGVRVLSRLVHVETDDASAAYVRAEPSSTHKKIIDLCERDGHQLFSMAHSHIMHGVDSTRPSGVDIAHQERLCAMGLDEVLGCIFNLSSHVRFFSTAHAFDLSVYGNGVEVITNQPREKVLLLKP